MILGHLDAVNPIGQLLVRDEGTAGMEAAGGTAQEDGGSAGIGPEGKGMLAPPQRGERTLVAAWMSLGWVEVVGNSVEVGA